jgi:hypothetical protein
MSIIDSSPLTRVSAALHAKNPLLVQKSMMEAPMGIKNKIYESMWQVMGGFSEVQSVEKIFANPDIPVQKKIEAVEKVILEDVVRIPKEYEQPILPNNAVEVIMPSFWDAGFDPRFDEDGYYLLPQGTRTMRQVIVETVAYCLFIFKAYLSPWKEVRELGKAILAGASLEEVWSSYYVRFLVKNIDDPCQNWISLAEYDFLENAGDILKKLYPSLEHPLRQFPREVIYSIHKMNKPQVANWADDQELPAKENQDLARCGMSFVRLSKATYVLESEGKEKHSFDAFNYDYVPHYLFVNATRRSAKKLKIACRDLRQQIAETTIDFKCALSFASCQQKLRLVFDRFEQAWNAYVASHELLAENQEVWSKVDYRKEEYEALRAETKLSPKKADENRRDKNRPSELAYDACQANVKAAYLEQYPYSKTGRILKARDETLLTLRDKV